MQSRTTYSGREEFPSEAHSQQSQTFAKNLKGLARFSLLWGVLAYIGFYAALPYMPVQKELLIRYCTRDPLEYITMALFFPALAALVIHAMDLFREQSALRRYTKAIGQVSGRSLKTSSENAQAVKEQTQRFSGDFDETISGRRLQEALLYHQESDGGDRLDDHLRHVSDLEADRAVQRFGLVNTITWAVPILGFLGTVMGITIAIANVSPEQLDNSLPQVTGGLAIAFDTTALSLSLSLILVFATFLVRRKQDEILLGIDQQLNHRLCYLLMKSSGQETGITLPHETMSRQLVEASAMVVAEASSLWRNRLQKLEESFAESLQQEQWRVAQVLQQGLSRSLDQQQARLDEIREQELLQSQHISGQLQAAMLRWEQSLATTAGSLDVQSQELRQHSELVLSLIDKQQELTRVQQQIHQSLDASQIASTLDQTLNSLTAAIQLLNARVTISSRAA